MKSLSDEWWIQEIDSAYRSLKEIASYIIFISWCSRTLNSMYSSRILGIFETLMFGISIFLYFLAQKFVFSHKGKIIMAIVVAEYANFWTWTIVHLIKKDYNPLAIIFSTIFIIFIQTQYVRSSIIVFAIGIKHIIQWYVIPAYFGLAEYSHDIHTYIGIGGILLLNYLKTMRSRMVRLERFEYKSKLEETKQKFFVVLQNFPDGLIVISNSSQIELVNEKIQSMLNCSKDSLLNIINSLCYYEQDTNSTSNHRLIEDIDNCAEFDMDQEITLGIVLFNEKFLEWRAKKILWGSDEAIIITVHNIDHIMHSQQALTQRRFKNAVFHSLSHELRTPINAIISILDQALINDINKDKLALAYVSSKQLLSSINDMLDFSRIVNGTFKSLSTNCSVRKMIDEIHQLIKKQALQKGIDIRTRIDESIPDFINSDSNRIFQILLNLSMNALKFTKRGYIEICAILTFENKLKFIIRDTGIGFSYDKLKWIREMLINMKVTDIGKEGLGLGLYISNMIVKQLGGSHIRIHSELGVYTSFSFSIDIGLEKPEIFDDYSLKVPSERKFNIINRLSRPRKRSLKIQKKVLLVDDNDLNRAVVGTVLDSEHISYMEASDGKEAVNKIIEYDKLGGFKVVIMDCNMPIMDGWEATSTIIQMHNDNEISNLPVIIGYTAFTSDEDVQLCYRCGMVEYIAKPASTDILLKSIFRYLDE
ncbi:unnamed protein product [Blepharisma stoltei]|uniref:Histidine kinase n=1 Tax=Blepharisma stoltei TaxID=1481888 RepID=A0AAU9JXK2_9CILI|nr:unnamed protein product [Blepharisma stoltei]